MDHWVLDPLRVDDNATSAVLSTHIHYGVGRYLSGYPIPMIDYT